MQSIENQIDTVKFEAKYKEQIQKLQSVTNSKNPVYIDADRNMKGGRPLGIRKCQIAGISACVQGIIPGG
jgi:hypothetical protein